MTHTHFIGAVVIGLQLVLGFGVYRVLQNTSFVADALTKGMDHAAEEMAQLTSQEDFGEEFETNTIGFHLPVQKGE